MVPLDQPTTSSRRLSFVDGVRAVAAGYVVLHHIWLTSYPEYPRNTGPAVLGVLAYGHLAVAVFIVVSGFSLTIAPAGRGYRLGGVMRFVRRRAWRILPPYWAALALSALVFGVVTPNLTGGAIDAKGLAVHAVLMQDVINSTKPNGAFWSIAIEWQIYFLFPLVLLVLRHWGARAAITLSCTAAIGAQVLAVTFPPLHGLTNFTPQFFALFVFGAVAATFVSRTAPRRSALVGLTTMAMFAVVATAQGTVWVDRHYFVIDLLIGAATALVLLGMAHGRAAPLERVLSSSPVRAAGLFSYSTYLVHLPALWLVSHFVVDHLVDGRLARFVLLVVLGSPAVLAVSYGFHLLFERPFLEHRSIGALRRSLRRGPTEPGVARTTSSA